MPRFNLARYIKTFPKKHHVEYITAILSVPVLLSVIALNLLNLQNNSKREDPQPTPVEKSVIVQITGTGRNTPPTVAPTDAPFCKKEVGPISITSPQEGEIISDNPVCISINYEAENFCSVVWSYRINGSRWSDYNSSSPCLYDLPAGDVKFELRVQSTVSQDTEVLERNFTYVGASATPSAGPEN